ncbi:cytochrome b5 [Choiromyces venosus 120613-1]|uniref:Cytochrome b5 n=1 Tax=Choiromyces venosus 120613-1 TaxID=1336337 RepID=A0A3N4JIA2_9PEZI|nr:cytochrome b5 [Choiromyces venosus 120613-1]
MSAEYTFADVKEHQSKKDLWLVVYDKVYSCGEFVDEHPGGEEVLMDVAGQDATLAFEDVGHSDEAREILNGLLVGTLKRTASDPKPVPSTSSPSQTQSNDAGTAVYAFFFVAVVVAFGAYKMYA